MYIQIIKLPKLLPWGTPQVNGDEFESSRLPYTFDFFSFDMIQTILS